jgi:hypothetical protein
MSSRPVSSSTTAKVVGRLVRFCPMACDRPCYLSCEVLDVERPKEARGMAERQGRRARPKTRSVRRVPAPSGSVGIEPAGEPSI